MARRTRRKTPWIIAGLIAFVLADLALVGFALRDTESSSNAVSAIEPGTSFTPNPSGSSGASPAPTAVPTTTPPATGAPAASISGKASAKVSYRATPGTCSGDDTSTDAVIEISTDGGSTWTDVTPSDIRIRAVEKMIVVDESHVDLLAKYGGACTESDVTTYTQGEFWQVYPDRTAQFK